LNQIVILQTSADYDEDNGTIDKTKYIIDVNVHGALRTCYSHPNILRVILGISLHDAYPAAADQLDASPQQASATIIVIEFSKKR